MADAPVSWLTSIGNRARMGVSQKDYLKRLASVKDVLAAMGVRDVNAQDRFMGQLVAAETGRPEGLISAANNAGMALESVYNPFGGNTPANQEYQETVAQAGDRGRALGMERRRLIEKTDRERREQMPAQGLLAGLFGR
jgi:hypothetical protein